MRRHHQHRVLAFLGAAFLAMIALAIAGNVRSQVDRAATESPGTDYAGMLGMSMVGSAAMAAIGAGTLVVVAVKARPRRRWRPPPGWPPAPPGWEPSAGWVPDPSWPAAPPDWQWWGEEE